MLKHVIRLLQKDGWEIFQEVNTPMGIIDIVAKQKIKNIEITWGIEGKLSFSLDVMRQARNQFPYFNYFSIAIPCANNEFYKEILKSRGIGIILIDGYAKEYEPAKFKRVKTKRKVFLSDINKLGTAGSSSDRVSSFQNTMQEIMVKLLSLGQITVKDLLDDDKYHYSSLTGARIGISKGVLYRDYQDYFNITQDTPMKISLTEKGRFEAKRSILERAISISQNGCIYYDELHDRLRYAKFDFTLLNSQQFGQLFSNSSKEFIKDRDCRYQTAKDILLSETIINSWKIK